MVRTAHTAVAALLALLVTSGCAHRSPTPSGSSPAPTSAGAPGTRVVLQLTALTAPRVSGFYTVDVPGADTQRGTFTADSKGRWKRTVQVLPGATVRVVLLTTGRGTCEIVESGLAAKPDRSLGRGVTTCSATAVP